MEFSDIKTFMELGVKLCVPSITPQFRLVDTQEWLEDCTGGNEQHQLRYSTVCMSCRQIHITTDDRVELTIDQLIESIKFIESMYSKPTHRQ
jgi:hypothetical protein